MYNRTEGTATQPYFTARINRVRAVKDNGYTWRNARIYISLSAELHARFGIDPKGPAFNAPTPVYKAWNALYVAAQREVLVALLVNEHGIPAELTVGAHLSFSRYAGCSCPCSPGWKCSPELTRAMSQNDFHIDAALGSDKVALVRVA